MNSFRPQPTAPNEQIRQNLAVSIPALARGDIIATSSNAVTSQGIRWATNGRFSHAILYLGNGQAIDANPFKPLKKDLLKHKLRDSKQAIIFRHRTASQEQLNKAASWAGSQSGKDYDFTGAARSALQPNARTGWMKWTTLGVSIIGADEISAAVSGDGHNATFFCSELIFRAFRVAGIPLLDDPPTWLGPNRFLKTTELVLMGQLDLGR
ncbi:YiiX/YebB-like N1pC/P60 family cysteine hydrolase [Salicola sp. Rm-C-2C1-2]|uniref:YiiX/YebB-like N1pC/P60 family cysteine hydrolase n=1 Tax=Salicola sp. Rm-C-2C1-2 TaxID=3141321 RepID=UPI0032E3D62D